MAKKGRSSEGKASVAGGRKDRKPFELFSIPFANADRDTVKRHLLALAGASLVTKFLVILITTAVLHSFIDFFDLQFYLEHATNLLQGQIPYLGYNFEYPVLILVPMILSLLPAVILGSQAAFIFTFMILMVLCDLGILACVYFTALKIRGPKIAFLAGLLYATAFSTAYFVLTKYDAFPTLLLMLAVFFTVCGSNVKGYIAAGLGFFAKIFPAISFPFLILYNAKKSSIRDEIVSTLKVMIPLAIILMLPILIIRPESIQTYLFVTGTSVGVYVNTLTFTIFSWISTVGHIGIPIEAVSLAMYALMGIALLLLLYAGYRETAGSPLTLVKLLLCAIVAVVYFTKFHSPQYIIWFTPLLCLLAAGDIRATVLFYAVQVFAYIEFPLMFGTSYTNLEYASPAGSPAWMLTLVFFTAEYLVLAALLMLVVRPKEGFRALLPLKKGDAG